MRFGMNSLNVPKRCQMLPSPVTTAEVLICLDKPPSEQDRRDGLSVGHNANYALCPMAAWAQGLESNSIN